MSYQREPLATVRERVLKALDTQDIPYSFKGLLGSSISGLSHMLHGHMEFLNDTTALNTAKAEILGNRWAQPLGLYRLHGKPETVSLSVKGTQGHAVPTTWIIVGKKFHLRDTVYFPETGVIEILCEAEEVLGDDVRNSKTATAQTASEFVSSSAEVLSFFSGAVPESDDGLRRRIYQSIQAKPQGGSYLDYITWVESVPGVLKSWVKTCDMIGLGTPGHVWITWVEADGKQTVSIKNQIEDLLKRLAPAHACVSVKEFIIRTIEIKLKIKPDTAEIRKNVEDKINDFFKNNMIPAGYLDDKRKATPSIIHLSHIGDCINSAEGQDHHIILSPTGETQLEDGEVAQCKVIFI